MTLIDAPERFRIVPFDAAEVAAARARSGSGASLIEVLEAAAQLPPDEFGIPPADPTKQVKVRGLKNRWGGSAKSDGPDEVATRLGRGRTVSAGGMVYISSVGPIDLENGQLAGESMMLQAAKALENL